MKTEPIYLKKSNVIIQFVEIGNDTYFLEEKLKPKKCSCCGDDEPRIRVVKQRPVEEFVRDVRDSLHSTKKEVKK